MSERGSIYFNDDGELRYDDKKVLYELALHPKSYAILNSSLPKEKEEKMIFKLRETYHSPNGKETIQKLIDSDKHQDLIIFYGFGDLCSEKSMREWRKNEKRRRTEAHYNNNFMKFEYDMDKLKTFEEDEKKWKHYWLSTEAFPECSGSRLLRLREESNQRRRRCLSESDLKHDEWDYFKQKITGKIMVPPIPIRENMRIVPKIDKKKRM